MPETLIEVQNVSKKFCRDLKTSLWYGVKDLFREMTGQGGTKRASLRKKEFWAVDDVSVTVNRGECLGLIGPNGSGKSTLLKMINGLIKPDRGQIKVRGRVGALIELGAGFSPILTGRENIYVNAAVLGITKREIDKQLDAIIDFAGIEEFIDTPVQSYSSGMKVRLGFSVAANIRPDILLVDEVLAVGDIGFRAKCYNRIAELMENCAVVIVSHQMPAIARVSSKCMVLNNSHSIFQGVPEEAIQQYQSLFDEEKVNTQHPLGSGEAEIEMIKLYNINNEESKRFQYGDPIKISFDVKVSPKYEFFLVSIGFKNQESQLVAQCNSGYNSVKFRNDGVPKHIEIRIPKLFLNPGYYTLGLIIYDQTNTKYLYWHHTIKTLHIVGDFVGTAPTQWEGEWLIY